MSFFIILTSLDWFESYLVGTSSFVLLLFSDANYQNATSFVVSFYLNTTNEEMNWKADRWMEEINAYAGNYPTKDMAICVLP